MPSCCTLPRSEQGERTEVKWGGENQRRVGSGLPGVHCRAQLEAEGLLYSGKSSLGEPETCSQFHMAPSSSRYQTSVDFLET